ncbi:Rcf3p ASCRUDRAFT_74007 [Ascoidea rubescens DSM 1968]|uniref:Uncharacterized protein n=1 Tax=Ascoidea rubescens DSM 1968 TaxID=1344418 RepID=A0A1D2VS20_9ASCO|nr:hypothetical protein ASCRUDRAFT_74007 [Ascoidea rubescens DSM 1968]ODV64367.1 hypothetical protein ASCRUDRAFT_74007 [Ascoidea rubescens DSM 1968]
MARSRESENTKTLSKELLLTSFTGAIKGGLIGLTGSVMLRYMWPTWKNLRIPIKCFWHVSWVSMGAVFWADRHLVVFSDRMLLEQQEKKRKLLNDAAENGIFIDYNDKTVLTVSQLELIKLVENLEK